MSARYRPLDPVASAWLPGLLLAMLALVILTMSVGCASGPHQVQWNGSWLSRIVSGDVPRTPDEAQSALDEITRQVRQFEAIPRAACVIACARTQGCPPACIHAEELRLRLVELRGTMQVAIDTWRAGGGSASEAATEAFLELLARRRPELAAAVDLLRAWRGEETEGGPIVPGGNG